MTFEDSQPTVVKSRDITLHHPQAEGSSAACTSTPAGEGRQDVPLMALMMDARCPPFLPGGFAQGELEVFRHSSGGSAALEQWGHLKAAMMSLNTLNLLYVHR